MTDALDLAIFFTAFAGILTAGAYIGRDWWDG